MKKVLLILLSISFALPIMAIEQTKPIQQPKKPFGTKIKIAVATVGAIVTTAVIAFFGHKLVYGEKQKPSIQPSQSITEQPSPLKPIQLSEQQSAELNQKLFDALYLGSESEKVKGIITDGASTAIQDSRGNTPLRIAVEAYAAPETIKLLSKGQIENRSVLNFPDAEGNTPLSAATNQLLNNFNYDDLDILNKDLEMLKVLVDEDATAQHGSLTSKLQNIDQSTLSPEKSIILDKARELLKTAESRVELKLKSVNP